MGLRDRGGSGQTADHGEERSARNRTITDLTRPTACDHRSMMVSTGAIGAMLRP
jgi:hypothetical protein